ncbi:unnamed protein product [Thelazia callipaeda]|uniref:Trithorax group protein osa n=1 Tax=Thelazia callipaeda TaxID=103827 RepID=A0A0N5CWG7_THECL|nr:unnamed protein product [Thelazia callipaeda]
MEGSTSYASSDSDITNTSRESETINEICNTRTPASGSNTSSFVNEAPSPLGHLDPHRLRDMVVDKQTMCLAQIESPYKHPYWTPSPAGPSQSPSNIHAVNSCSPVTQIRPPSRLPALLSPNTPHTLVQQQPMGMCLSARSPMGSPSSMHPPPSPFISRTSNTSPSYMQPPQTPLHYQPNLHSSASGNVVPPAGHVVPPSPSSPYSQRMTTMGPPQQQYSCHTQMPQPQWSTGQQTQHFGSGPVHRVMMHRVPYPSKLFNSFIRFYPVLIIH